MQHCFTAKGTEHSHFLVAPSVIESAHHLQIRPQVPPVGHPKSKESTISGRLPKFLFK